MTDLSTTSETSIPHMPCNYLETRANARPVIWPVQFTTNGMAIVYCTIRLVQIEFRPGQTGCQLVVSWAPPCVLPNDNSFISTRSRTEVLQWFNLFCFPLLVSSFPNNHQGEECFEVGKTRRQHNITNKVRPDDSMPGILKMMVTG